jgi:hypothetical protein
MAGKAKLTILGHKLHSGIKQPKNPILKNIKLTGSRRNRPPLYEREMTDENISSLPVIVNSLSISQKNSVNSQSPKLLKRYELKGKIMKPSQRLAYMGIKYKVGVILNCDDNFRNHWQLVSWRANKLSHQISRLSINS